MKASEELSDKIS